MKKARKARNEPVQSTRKLRSRKALKVASSQCPIGSTLRGVRSRVLHDVGEREPGSGGGFLVIGGPGRAEVGAEGGDAVAGAGAELGVELGPDFLPRDAGDREAERLGGFGDGVSEELALGGVEEGMGFEDTF